MLPQDMRFCLSSILPFYRKGKKNPEGTLVARLPVTTALEDQKYSGFPEEAGPEDEASDVIYNQVFIATSPNC